MKEIRPFQIIILGVFALLALVGVAVFATYGKFSGGNSGEIVIGNVQIWGTLPEEGMVAALDTLRITDDRFRDVRYVQKATETFENELANALASGAGPDLVIITQESLLSERSKLLLIPFTSIPERSFVNTYVPMSSLFLTAEGTYGIPFVLDPLVLYYNKTILATEGVAQPPGSWEAIVSLSERVSKRENDQTILQSTVALGEYENITNARAILSLFLLQAGSTITVPDNAGYTGVLSERPVGVTVNPAESAVNFYTQFSNPVKTTYSWNRSFPPSRTVFLSGDLALYLGFASEQPLMTASNPNLEFDMAKIPQPGTRAGRVTYGNLYAFAIPKASEKNAGALATALGLTEEGPLKVAAEILFMAPASRSLLTPKADDLYAPIFYPEALTAKGWLSPSARETDGIFSTMIGSVTTGRSDTNDALEVADQALHVILR